MTPTALSCAKTLRMIWSVALRSVLGANPPLAARFSAVIDFPGYTRDSYIIRRRGAVGLGFWFGRAQRFPFLFGVAAA